MELELLQIALGFREHLSCVPSAKDWEACYRFAEDQAIAGILFHGVSLIVNREPLIKESIGIDILMDWLGQVEYLKSQNEIHLELIKEETKALKDNGISSVVLKGQSLSQYYPDWLVRTPGDVDLWAFAARDKINDFCRSRSINYDAGNEGEMHTSYERRGITVEMHYTATKMSSRKYSKRLDRWLLKNDGSMRNQNSLMPALEFNLVYLLLHMYRHYLFEGIGLRHVTDYCIVLQRASEDQRTAASKTLYHLGVRHFACALMYVLKEYINLSAEYLICKPDPWRGRMLMNAILKGGNFGKADKINDAEHRQWGIKRVWRFVSRNAVLFFAYPDEISWHIVKKLRFR